MSMNRTERELVSASELAQLGYCERVAHFDWRYGAKRTAEQVHAQERGNAAHDRFYQDGIAIARASEKKGRCFVATLALGECAETQELRAFRDLYLRRTAAGRWFIGVYYRSGPVVCDWLGGRSSVLRVVRVCIRLAARAAAWANARKLHR
jgi:hypothetical protein